MPRASATALDAGPAPADLDTPLPLGRIRLALFLAGFATFSLLYSVQPLLPAPPPVPPVLRGLPCRHKTRT